MSTRRKLAGSALALAVGVSVVGLTAPAADASVMVSAPRQSVTVHEPLEPGVWYRSDDGGSRAYQLTVVGPHGHVRMQRAGAAPTHWKSWRMDADRAGTWKTVYRVKDANGDWHRAVFRTSVHR